MNSPEEKAHLVALAPTGDEIAVDRQPHEVLLVCVAGIRPQRGARACAPEAQRAVGAGGQDLRWADVTHIRDGLAVPCIHHNVINLTSAWVLDLHKCTGIMTRRYTDVQTCRNMGVLTECAPNMTCGLRIHSKPLVRVSKWLKKQPRCNACEVSEPSCL